MNLIQGMLRLWILIALCWAVPVAWFNRDDLMATRQIRLSDVKSDPNSLPENGRLPDWQVRVPAVVLVATPPIALFIIVLGMIWVGRGFGITISIGALRAWQKR